MTDAELKQLLAGLSDKILQQRGHFLYSGTDTLKPGRDFYFLGFNPKADGTNDLLQEMCLHERNWSAYTCQCWMCKGKCDPKTCSGTGEEKHQKNVKHIMAELGIRPEETFATNFVFVESDDIPTLKKDPFFRDYVDACWEVHKKFLADTKPKYIMCLGNGKTDSAYSLVRAKAKAKSSERFSKESVGKFTAFKSFFGKFELDGGKTLDATVVGVLHPSYWRCPPGLLRFVKPS